VEMHSPFWPESIVQLSRNITCSLVTPRADFRSVIKHTRRMSLILSILPSVIVNDIGKSGGEWVRSWDGKRLIICLLHDLAAPAY
jgi:hypothetical protein